MNFFIENQHIFLTLVGYLTLIYTLPPALATKVNVASTLLKLVTQVLDKLSESRAGLSLEAPPTMVDLDNK